MLRGGRGCHQTRYVYVILGGGGNVKIAYEVIKAV